MSQTEWPIASETFGRWCAAGQWDRRVTCKVGAEPSNCGINAEHLMSLDAQPFVGTQFERAAQITEEFCRVQNPGTHLPRSIDNHYFAPVPEQIW